MLIYFRLITIVFLISVTSVLFAQTITQLQAGKPTSIRGLSVVDDSVAWVSGSKGYFAITRNGGKSWAWQQITGYEKSDFRDIEAFSAKEAIVMSSGTPALILKTVDGGANWQVKYKNADTAYFFDAMGFANKQHGLVLGDPIKNKFVLMETTDHGDSWHPFKNPPNALPGEAAFAASGTCLRLEKDRVTGQEQIIIVTGGSVARQLVFYNDASGGVWQYSDRSLKHGKPSQGAFSIALGDCNVIVGGDYQKDKLTDSVTTYWCYNGTYAGGPWHLSAAPPKGYQSCVEYISDQTFLSTGTPGSNITSDGGQTWRQIDTASYNVCRKAKSGKLILLAGDKGAIGILKP